ncbi:uncharacterized protein LOC117100194 [Anneissia japonica]|uniref:uncharacterized protein LOC117100194 n=1 Tax=Anneissia japonica TaxID=1529436 RepID=UPI00142569FB|nr:uncharacterized protein LOC117100194 [Anneissia japonica]
MGQITLSEVKQAIQKTKNWKAPGEDKITGEMIKASIDVSSKALRKLLNRIWEEEEVPEDWKSGIIMYSGYICCVLHEGKTTDKFEVTTGVRQGCMLSHFLFLLAIDWTMKMATLREKEGIPWTLTRQLEDLDFADDICLISANQAQMQRKTDRVVKQARSSWRTNRKVESRLRGFEGRCLRRILNIRWPDRVTNMEIRRKTQINDINEEIRKRRWNWLGHVLRLKNDGHPRQAERWKPMGKRKRGRPKGTWRRTVEEERKHMSKTINEISWMAQDRGQWKSFVALCAYEHEED